MEKVFHPIAYFAMQSRDSSGRVRGGGAVNFAFVQFYRNLLCSWGKYAYFYVIDIQIKILVSLLRVINVSEICV